jgi:hypothetical protein
MNCLQMDKCVYCMLSVSMKCTDADHPHVSPCFQRVHVCSTSNWSTKTTDNYYWLCTTNFLLWRFIPENLGYVEIGEYCVVAGGKLKAKTEDVKASSNRVQTFPLRTEIGEMSHKFSCNGVETASMDNYILYYIRQIWKTEWCFARTSDVHSIRRPPSKFSSHTSQRICRTIHVHVFKTLNSVENYTRKPHESIQYRPRHPMNTRSHTTRKSGQGMQMKYAQLDFCNPTNKTKTSQSYQWLRITLHTIPHVWGSTKWCLNR